MARALILLSFIWLSGSALLFQTNNHVDQSEREKPVFVGDQIRDTEIAVNASMRLFRGIKSRIPLLSASVLGLVGAGLFGLGLAYAKKPPPLTPLSVPNPSAINWFLAGLGGLFLAIFAESNAQLTGKIPLLSIHWQYFLLCFGLVLVVLGLGNDKPSKKESASPWLLILAISLLGLFLRIWDLDRLRVMVDELPFTETMLNLQSNPQQGLLIQMNNVFPFPRLFSYWIMSSVNTFGNSYGAIRVPSALAGALTLPLCYLLASRLFNRQVGLLSLLLLLSFPPHIHFSRLGLLHIFDTLAGVAAFAFLLKGLQSGQRQNFALSGAALGMTQYFYEGGRLLFPVLMLLWCAILLWQSRAVWRGIALTWFIALLVAAPVYYTIHSQQNSGVQRLETVGLTSDYWNRLLQANPNDPILQAHFDRTLNPVLHYFSIPDMSVFYSGQTPLLLLPLVPFFMMGVVYLLYHFRHPASSLLLSWLAGTAFGSSLLVESGVTARFVVVFPALAVISALGLWACFSLLIPDRRLAWRLMSALCILFALGQSHYYFTSHLSQFDYAIRHIKPYPDGEDALLHFMAQDYHQGTSLIIVSNPPTPAGYLSLIFQFLSPERYYPFDARHPHEITEPYLKNLQNGFDIAFFLQPGDDYSRSLIESYFELEAPRRSPYHEQVPDDRELWLYFAPAFVLESAEPIEWD